MTAGVETILPLLGAHTVVVHGRADEGDQAGGDIDCVVKRLDPSWPLRLPPAWRLCQVLEYDITASQWRLDHDGRIIVLDILDDERGLGKYGFSTAQEIGPAARAVYLTAKRVRKRVDDPRAWAEVSPLAADDTTAYVAGLRRIFGRRLAVELGQVVTAQGVPAGALARRARRRLVVRQPLLLPWKVFLHVRRLLRRVRRPAGVRVLVVGPDGAGKSTLAHALPASLDGLFRRNIHVHWRPSLLPPPGAFLRRRARDEAAGPHGAPPHSRLLSLLLLLYYFADFAVGSHIAFRWARVRASLVVEERGWWDIHVDPARYRLNVPPRLVALLGRLLPQPDVVLLPKAPPADVRRRKPELDEAEIEAIFDRWSRLLRNAPMSVELSGDEQEVRAAARRVVVEFMERRACGRTGPGWISLPSRRSPRWTLARPRGAAVASLGIYAPVTVRAQLGWQAARFALRAGVGRIAPAGSAPAREIREIVAEHVPRGGSLAASRSMTFPGRSVVALLDRGGRVTGVAKVALDEGGQAKLRREEEAITLWARHLPAPLRVPTVIASAPGILLFEPISRQRDLRPWRLDPRVAEALGVFYARTGAAHGDCAPWNLLREDDRAWALLDWEDAAAPGLPFEDVFHFLIRASTLVKRPRPSAVIDGLAGRGWVADCIAAYAAAAALDRRDARDAFDVYVRRSCRSDSVVPSATPVHS